MDGKIISVCLPRAIILVKEKSLPVAVKSGKQINSKICKKHCRETYDGKVCKALSVPAPHKSRVNAESHRQTT